jgi:tetratricopeptide (TPR) repeat protein
MPIRRLGSPSPLDRPLGDDSLGPSESDSVPAELLERIDLTGTAADRENTPDTLPDDLYDELDRLAMEGNERVDEGELVEALRIFRRGIELLPQPRYRWHAAEWFLAGIGDALWLLERYLNAAPIWDDMLIHTGALGKGWVHLRRGQTLYELGDFREAENELLRALILEGWPLFANEDRKYWDYITARVRPPEGWTSWEGWPGAKEGHPMHTWLMGLDLYEFRARTTH